MRRIESGSYRVTDGVMRYRLRSYEITGDGERHTKPVRELPFDHAIDAWVELAKMRAAKDKEVHFVQGTASRCLDLNVVAQEGPAHTTIQFWGTMASPDVERPTRANLGHLVMANEEADVFLRALCIGLELLPEEEALATVSHYAVGREET